MKTSIRLILSVSLLMVVSLILPALAEDVQIPILIDGVRVAFFDAQGNLLSQKKHDDMVYVPIQSFCESLGMEAEVQGQSVSVDGKRIGMFDAAGNYLAPVQFDGVDYVPLMAFCEANALQVADEYGKISITRAKTGEAVVETKEAAGKVALHPYNFGDYFSYGIQEQNFETVQTRYQIDGGFLYCNDTEVDYVLTCNARSAFEIENVSFSVSADVWEADAMTSGIRGVSFSEDMPANGSLTKTRHQTGSAFVGVGLKATKASLEKTELTSVSGCIIVDKEKADAANLASYQKGVELLKSEAYDDAEAIFEALHQISYLGAEEKLNEISAAKKVLKEKADQEREKVYQNAISRQEAGDYEQALELFDSIGFYKDSVMRAATCKEVLIEKTYQDALQYEKEGDYAKALEGYQSILEYKDSKERSSYLEFTLQYLDAPYDQILSFSEGFACVKKHDKWGIIDTTGKLLVPYKWDAAISFSEGLAGVEKNGKLGFIDTIGKLVIPCEWDSVRSFHEGFAVVQKGNSYGYINTSGTLVIPTEWDVATDFSEGLAVVKKNSKYGFIDATGKLVIPCEWDGAYHFSEGLAVVKKNGKYGVIDTSGTLVVPCKWYFILSFSEGLAAVSDGKKYGFINSEGTVVIPCEWKNAGSFSEGLAAVEKNYKYGYIDATGKLVIPCQWYQGFEFSEGRAKVLDARFGFIDSNGELVTPCEWNMAFDFSDGLAVVKKDDKYKCIDPQGNIVIE